MPGTTCSDSPCSPITTSRWPSPSKSPLASEKPKSYAIQEAADWLREARTAGRKNLVVAGPALLTNHITGSSKLRHTDLTAVASLFDDYTVFAVNADSPIKTGKDLVERLRKAEFGMGDYVTREAAAAGGGRHPARRHPAAGGRRLHELVPGHRRGHDRRLRRRRHPAPVGPQQATGSCPRRLSRCAAGAR